MFSKIWEEHPGTLIGLAIGILVGIIYLIVGFWKTVIFIFFVSIGVYLGKKIDNRQDIRDILEEILPEKFFKK